MATLPAFMRRMEATRPEDGAKPAPLRVARDRYQLRALPQDDVFFFCKKIDNSRLVREPDPRAKSACWSAIGVACLAVALLAGVLVPGAASTISGYRLESLRAEERRLIDERRALDLQEAELLSPERLDQLAHNQHLVTPKSDQVFHLEGSRPDAAVAMVKK
jgi:cell division protein FtsL